MSSESEKNQSIAAIAILMGQVEEADGKINAAYHIEAEPGIDRDMIAHDLAERTGGRVLGDEEIQTKRLDELINPPDRSNTGRSFSVGSKRWNSSWEPRGPKAPWKQTKTDD